ncbi:sensor histidine kinase [Hymenobacter volaticus]|uniref:histidine kinase n=1 Tax=Hymenobacter volaticus TaxID=2932254 RepID=A0ABY4G8E3_9BACT|nr:ATP-binding protein [Hymenobacter volaticus]UOQ67040.1 ATP-binding protein [Hymenobacter volaticus]
MNINTELLFTAAVSFGITRALSKFLNLPARSAPWDALLRRIWVPGVVLFVLAAIFRVKSELLNDGYWLLVFGAVATMLIRLGDYRPARTLLLAIAPFALYFAIQFLLSLLGTDIVRDYDDVFETTQGFAIFWMITFGLIARSQKKHLEAERLLREEEERNKQRIEAQNAELERLVSERTAALTQQAEELRYTLTELKTTQAQLIQAEKMASLGELTAGIAHEIQNPLNFVNNFSEVSSELLQELEEEQQKPTRDAELESELLADLKQNLQKITHHGQRASSIVRGMLEHSRASNGERHPTDLNSLCDEYLRLAYHGLRAKDKTFNATLTTHFDPNLGMVDIVTQDVGRVLLNLLTNAFYAVQQRQKLQEAGYQPTVTVSTKQGEECIELKVRDNGMGIPEEVKQKIFQPFFTTKPTGEGTGLGLSLSYDIITKGHNGTLSVESVEGQCTEFIITLPLTA